VFSTHSSTSYVEAEFAEPSQFVCHPFYFTFTTP